ncbi:MAG: hypothetical protein NVS1B12_13690 [Acidimicrobiales bacterium]
MTVVAVDAGSDRRLAVRLGGAMSLVVAAAGMAQVAMQPPRPSARALLFTLIGVYALLGVLGLTRPTTIPDSIVALAVVGGTLAIPAGMLAKGAPSIESTDNAMLFLIPVVYGAYFFGRRWSLIVVLLACSSYGAVLVHLQAAQGPTRWLTSSAALGAVAGVVNALKSRDAERLGEMQDQAVSDPLTGLANRRALEHQGPRLLEAGGPSSLLLLDIDWFKEINDTFGHAVGDDVLVRTARALTAAVRGRGMAVRLGGDEFVLLLPGCRPQTGTAIADSIRRQVRDATVAGGTEVSVSIGVAASDGAVKLSELLRAADTALYRAKRSGRDTVRFAWVDSEISRPGPVAAAEPVPERRRVIEPVQFGPSAAIERPPFTPA